MADNMEQCRALLDRARFIHAKNDEVQGRKRCKGGGRAGDCSKANRLEDNTFNNEVQGTFNNEVQRIERQGYKKAANARMMQSDKQTSAKENCRMKKYAAPFTKKAIGLERGKNIAL